MFMSSEPRCSCVFVCVGAVVFTPEQKAVLIRYFEDYGMTSTHRRNTELMQRCAEEIGTTIERVKNWIGSEAVKRKRKAGILPRPKIEITGVCVQMNVMAVCIVVQTHVCVLLTERIPSENHRWTTHKEI